MLTVHHLEVSQSERIVWLCEELGIPYTLRLHQRDPLAAPAAIKSLHPLGAAPIIEDDGLPSPLAESAACIDWIIHKHGQGRLALAPDHKDYAQYLYWYHVANGSVFPTMARWYMLSSALKDDAHPSVKMAASKLDLELAYYDEHLQQNEWLAGTEFTAADVMTVFGFTTMRCFIPLDLSKYEGILGWLKRVAGREAYVRAMEKGDPEIDWKGNMHGPPPKSLMEELKEKKERGEKAKH